MAFRDGARLAALAPLFQWGYGTRPEVVQMSFLGAGISDYLGLISLPEAATAAAHLVFLRMAETKQEWSVCDLQELHPDSPLLWTAIPEALSAANSPCGVCPVLTPPRHPDELLAARKPHFRRNLRTAEKALRACGEIRLVEASAGQTDAAMQALFRLHAERWQERQQDGMFGTPRLRSFHLEVASRFATQGLLRLYALQVNGETIAVQYNFIGHHRAYCYLSGFDPAWRRFSPGALVLAHSLYRAIEEGVEEIDFLRKSEAFKYEWGARDRVNRQLLLTNSASLVEEVA
jgi:CelD/BcsL family acetyltransferase involved in cellulose biosynthesis